MCYNFDKIFSFFIACDGTTNETNKRILVFRIIFSIHTATPGNFNRIASSNFPEMTRAWPKRNLNGD